MTKYLDPESVTTVALNKMEEEFGSSGTAQVMISGEDLESLNQILLDIESIDGVDTVVLMQHQKVIIKTIRLYLRSFRR